MQRGWIKVWRKIVLSPIWTRPGLLKLFLLCLLKASHERKLVPVGGLAKPVEVLPGQFITGRYALHAEYYPVRRKSNVSEITLWRWLFALEKLEKVNIKTNSRYTLVSVCNWASYQNGNGRNDQPSGPEVNHRRSTGEQPVNTNKKVRREEEEETNDDAREVFHAPELELDLPPAVKARIEELAFQCWGTGAFPLADWVEHYVPTWIVPALEETLKQGKTDHRYTKGILERWRQQGGMDEKRDEYEFDYTPIV